MLPTEDIDRLSAAELRALVYELLGKVAELQRTVAAQRDEIARLKGGPGRPDIKPNIKPSGMEQASDPKPAAGGGNAQRRRGSTRAKLVIDEERKVRLGAVPSGARFKGTTSFVVQELVLHPHVIDFQCERWLAADGKVITAPLPEGFHGHFGPQLRRFVLTLYHQGQTTAPRLVTLLRGFGIDISKREVVRLLTKGHDRFHAEARAVLRQALRHSRWITVDDTGARHKARNGFCTQIGNAHFTAFITSTTKSRLNFLSLLRGGYHDYVVNDEALAYMRERALASQVIARLAAHPARSFADQKAWTAHLERLGIAALKVTPDPVLIATEGALWGSVKAHGFLLDGVIVSDDAGQFNVGQHGLCWVHAERLVHKLDTFTDQNRAAQASTRAAIWQLYSDLKAYRCAPTLPRKADLTAAFDRIFTGKTGFVTLDRLLARLHANKAELLKVLERPEIPLHTNGSENDIRSHVTRRKVSGGTRSDPGRDARDTFLGLAKTCAKLGVRFWDYLGARFAIEGSAIIPPLPQLIPAAAQPP
jgi:Transposase IS66 family